jgi:hypothetical protein
MKQAPAALSIYWDMDMVVPRTILKRFTWPIFRYQYTGIQSWFEFNLNEKNGIKKRVSEYEN